jgi:hypothetical protein
MSKSPKVLILGGGYAGLMAAARLGRQLAGGAEWRDLQAGRHYRALVIPKKVPWDTLSRIGVMTVRPEETLFIDDVVEIFCSFLQGLPFPVAVHWRDVTDELITAGVAPPAAPAR